MKPVRGFAILSAIFLIVVMAALAAFIASLSSSQQVGSAQDLQGVRAYQAARAGIEWGLYQQMQGGVNCPADNFFPGAATLTGFRVSVTCVPTPDANGGPTVRTLTATACSQPDATTNTCPNTTNPGPLYVERRIEVTF